MSTNLNVDPVTTHLRGMDDFRLLKFFRWYTTELVHALDMDREALCENVGTLRGDPRLSGVFSLELSDGAPAFAREHAVSVARTTLEAFAAHPNFRESLETALADFQDNEMPAEVILAIGWAATMIILGATTRLRAVYRNGKFTIEVGKEVASTEMLKAVVPALAKASQVTTETAGHLSGAKQG